MKETITYHDLEAYKLAFQLSLSILHLTAKINPTEDELKNKLLKSSATIAVNIAEGWVKRTDSEALIRHIKDAERAVGETKASLHLGMEYEAIHIDEYVELSGQYELLRHKVGELSCNWQMVS